MRGFDTIAVVDWSGVPDRGATPKRDAIWAAAIRKGVAETPVYLRSTEAAEAWLVDFLETEARAGRRVLAGFDFPFAYPPGVAQAIVGTDHAPVLWDWMRDALAALGPGEGRFDLVARMNRAFRGEGPFWFNGLKRDIPDLPRKKPPLPEGLAERRLCETREGGTFTCYQMGGAGAVGSQCLTGMALLAALRARLGDTVTVWPFEADTGAIRVVEVWPSLVDAAVREGMTRETDLPQDGKGPIKDAAQVVVLARALHAAQEVGELAAMLDVLPPEAQSEGWILGAGYRERLTDLARPTSSKDIGPVSSQETAPLAPPPLSDDCFALPPGVEWAPVDTALTLLRDRLFPVTGHETVATAKADGRILAEDAIAHRANPPGANAAVDGYGFAHDATGDGPQTLSLMAGRAAAGAPFTGEVPLGHAIRILTGALLPRGVDTVVLEEDTRSDASAVAFNGPVKRGANTRRAGEDVEAGATVLTAGHALRPPDLALLSATGIAEVAVRQRLRVGVLSTGDELAEPGETADPGRTYDANRSMLLSLVARWGHAAVDLGRVPDDRDTLRATLDGAAVDAVLTSGGASAGDEDHVSALLGEEGTLALWRIALKPGRPLALGMRDGVPVFGLPGNPVAALVCTMIFARPALSVLAGAGWAEPLAMTVPAAFTKRKKPGRREYLRARLTDEGAEVFASEGSGRISGLSWADGLVELGDGAAEIAPGDPVRFLPYAGFGL